MRPGLAVSAARAVASLARLWMGVAAALCLAPLAACEPGPNEEEARWEHVFTDLPAALLGVWGFGPDDVWVVGADAGNGPEVRNYRGASWRVHATGQRGTLWWVSGRSPDRVWMAGEAGLVLRYDRGVDRFTRVEGVPSSVTLYGIFETPDGLVWAVGGNAQGGRVFSLPAGGTAFVEEALPEGAATGRFFKVWGRSSTDLWVVGVGGDILYRDGAGWRVFASPGGARLTTVHGNATLAVAVGGLTEGRVVALDQGVTDASPPDVPPLNGVWVQADGTTVVVGAAGSVYERRGTVWRAPSGVPESLDDYHAVYVDPDGGVWAVGGFLLVEPQRRGMLLHYGPPVGRTIE